MSYDDDVDDDEKRYGNVRTTLTILTEVGSLLKSEVSILVSLFHEAWWWFGPFMSFVNLQSIKIASYLMLT